MKKLLLHTLILSTILFLVFTSTSFAKNDSVIYRHRTDWVKLVDLSKKELAGNQLLHPCSSLSVPQMTAMLMSLQVNKSQIFSKGFKTSEIFTADEAQKYAPYIIEALGKANANQVVNASIVHKRNYFVLKNDYLSMINVFITDAGVHFNFAKLFAKIEGEYAQAGQIDKAIKKAKSIRVALETSQGQTLVSDVDEIILDPSFDFGQGPVIAPSQIAVTTPTKTKTTLPAKTAPAVVATTPTVEPAGDDVKTRLEQLEELKKSKLITASEYKEKKEEILKGL